MKDWVDKVQIWGGKGSLWVDSPQTARRPPSAHPPDLGTVPPPPAARAGATPEPVQSEAQFRA